MISHDFYALKSFITFSTNKINYMLYFKSLKSFLQNEEIFKIFKMVDKGYQFLFYLKCDRKKYIFQTLLIIFCVDFMTALILKYVK